MKHRSGRSWRAAATAAGPVPASAQISNPAVPGPAAAQHAIADHRLRSGSAVTAPVLPRLVPPLRAARRCSRPAHSKPAEEPGGGAAIRDRKLVTIEAMCTRTALFEHELAGDTRGRDPREQLDYLPLPAGQPLFRSGAGDECRQRGSRHWKASSTVPRAFVAWLPTGDHPWSASGSRASSSFRQVAGRTRRSAARDPCPRRRRSA